MPADNAFGSKPKKPLWVKDFYGPFYKTNVAWNGNGIDYEVTFTVSEPQSAGRAPSVKSPEQLAFLDAIEHGRRDLEITFRDKKGFRLLNCMTKSSAISVEDRGGQKMIFRDKVYCVADMVHDIDSITAVIA